MNLYHNAATGGEALRTVRIFISSPGDVVEEREKARQVVERLEARYAGQAHLKPVLWEGLPLQVDMSFQQGIDLVLSKDTGSILQCLSSGRG